ncbi:MULTISPECIES: helicase associated domain-containing protein [Streptomyces]|uniref:helicase associated domain-containing protein n=1 Tax=Streptomyces TaxID=1883 RepID=UPI00287F558A|nr:helicase associated domain-containing protein [Streptomyces sp. CGMCC 4.1456]WNF67221.1 helicase associated domain-containing protein [Streptomyces sp. CGMCC 4.1456]
MSNSPRRSAAQPVDGVLASAMQRLANALDTTTDADGRLTALEAVDEHWNPAWPPEWQRHYAALRELVRDEQGHAEVMPGVTVHAMDIGKWLTRQRQHTIWQGLTDEQLALLEQLGITPLPPEPEESAKPSKAALGALGALGAFERGIAAEHPRAGTVFSPACIAWWSYPRRSCVRAPRSRPVGACQGVGRLPRLSASS